MRIVNLYQFIHFILGKLNQVITPAAHSDAVFSYLVDENIIVTDVLKNKQIFVLDNMTPGTV